MQVVEAAGVEPASGKPGTVRETGDEETGDGNPFSNSNPSQESSCEASAL